VKGVKTTQIKMQCNNTFECSYKTTIGHNILKDFANFT